MYGFMVGACYLAHGLHSVNICQADKRLFSYKIRCPVISYCPDKASVLKTAFRKCTQLSHLDLLLKSHLFTNFPHSETENHYVTLWQLNLGTQRIALFRGVPLLRMGKDLSGTSWRHLNKPSLCQSSQIAFCPSLFGIFAAICEDASFSCLHCSLEEWFPIIVGHRVFITIMVIHVIHYSLFMFCLSVSTSLKSSVWGGAGTWLGGGLVVQPTTHYFSGNFDLIAMISHFSYFPILLVYQKELPRMFSSFSDCL